MPFLEPKKKLDVSLNVKVSHDAKVILDEYASYTGYELGEMLVKMSQELLSDEKFVEAFKKKRSNKKVMAVYNKLVQSFHDEIDAIENNTIEE